VSTCIIPRKHRPKKKGQPSGSRRSGKGTKIRRRQPLHISVRILTTITIIATLMATLRKNVANSIQR